MDTSNAQSPKARGGARQGAGRKKKYVKNVFFSATQEVADILAHVGGNRSDFINQCILQATRQEK